MKLCNSIALMQIACMLGSAVFVALYVCYRVKKDKLVKEEKEGPSSKVIVFTKKQEGV